ncbi:hypothetical protein ACFLVZ_03375 [Chloroflexota bacterium]
MAIAAWISGTLGGLCAVMGIISAMEVIPALSALPSAFTPLFWLTLGVVLLLACIAFAVAQPQYE